MTDYEPEHKGRRTRLAELQTGDGQRGGRSVSWERKTSGVSAVSVKER